MSYAIKAARRGNRGDPGLFGFLGGVVKTVAGVASHLPGPLGIIGSGVKSAFGGGSRAPLAGPTGGGLRLPSGGIPSMPSPGLPGTGFGVPVPPMSGGGGGGGGAMGGGPCDVGKRRNKSRYFVERDIFGVKTGGITIVDPGERCVKARRMNPLNPRAISRAIRRLEGAKRATARLSRISIRGGCGCK